MAEPTLSAFKESLNALLDSNPHAKSKGDVFKDWCVDCFGSDARISHIREQRQTTNRVSEQYRYFSPIVVFVIDPVVKRDVLEQYIVERGYRQLDCVAIIGVSETADNTDSKYSYTFEKLLVYRNSAFAKWASDYFDSVSTMTSSACSFAHDSDLESLQIIYYGAPGTGKSHQTDKIVTDFPDRHIRTIFHPDSDYSSFVGCYKPTQDDDNEHEILYKFIPQPFIEAYVEAWHDISKPFFLIIEEINRGNCAQIFGDIFQLLDRDSDRGGISKYAITPDSDLRKFLAKEFAKDEYIDVPDDIRSGRHMRLPGNLYILATMNTSDQSLFPIDSAFKRRWDWEYKPIEQPKDARFCGWKIVTDDGAAYDWWSFLTAVNDRIFDTTQSEDKKMGYWFTKADAQKRISQKKFIGKVLFYLWNDIFKDYARTENTVFKVDKDNERKETEEYTFTDFFRSEGVTDRIHRLMFTLGIKREEWQEPFYPNGESEAEYMPENPNEIVTYWADFKQKLLEGPMNDVVGSYPIPSVPRFQTALPNDAGLTNTYILAITKLKAAKKEVAIGAAFNSGKIESIKPFLFERKEEINAKVKEISSVEPTWSENHQSITIYVRKDGIDMDWQVENYQALYAYFTELLREFKPNDEIAD